MIKPICFKIELDGSVSESFAGIIEDFVLYNENTKPQYDEAKFAIRKKEKIEKLKQNKNIKIYNKLIKNDTSFDTQEQSKINAVNNATTEEELDNISEDYEDI